MTKCIIHGLFAFDFERAIHAVYQSTVESIVREKFDTKGVRVFRLLLANGYLEQEQIEKLAMLSSKEGKFLTYQLMKEGFIAIREIAKTNDFAPPRTFYLFHVNIRRLAEILHLKTCKMLRNILLRKRHEINDHKWLTERQLKMETIVANIEADANLDETAKQVQVAEVEDTYLTVGDRQNLTRFRRGYVSLLGAQSRAQSTLFLLDLYLRFHKLARS